MGAFAGISRGRRTGIARTTPWVAKSAPSPSPGERDEPRSRARGAVLVPGAAENRRSSSPVSRETSHAHPRPGAAFELRPGERKPRSRSAPGELVAERHPRAALLRALDALLDEVHALRAVVHVRVERVGELESLSRSWLHDGIEDRRVDVRERLEEAFRVSARE